METHPFTMWRAPIGPVNRRSGAVTKTALWVTASYVWARLYVKGRRCGACGAVEEGAAAALPGIVLLHSRADMVPSCRQGRDRGRERET